MKYIFAKSAWVNFISILQSAFTWEDLKYKKRRSSRRESFCTFGVNFFQQFQCHQHFTSFFVWKCYVQLWYYKSLCFFAKMKPPKSSLQNFLEISYLCPHSIFGHKMFQKICFKIKNLYKSVRFTYKFQFFNR